MSMHEMITYSLRNHIYQELINLESFQVPSITIVCRVILAKIPFAKIAQQKNDDYLVLGIVQLQVAAYTWSVDNETNLGKYESITYQL